MSDIGPGSQVFLLEQENQRLRQRIEKIMLVNEERLDQIADLKELLREHLARISPLDAASGTLYRKTNAVLGGKK